MPPSVRPPHDGHGVTQVGTGRTPPPWSERHDRSCAFICPAVRPAGGVGFSAWMPTRPVGVAVPDADHGRLRPTCQPCGWASGYQSVSGVSQT